MLFETSHNGAVKAYVLYDVYYAGSQLRETPQRLLAGGLEGFPRTLILLGRSIRENRTSSQSMLDWGFADAIFELKTAYVHRAQAPSLVLATGEPEHRFSMRSGIRITTPSNSDPNQLS